MSITSNMLGYGKQDVLEPFLQPLGGRMATTEEILANTTAPMVVASIAKRIIPNQARLHGLDWYCIDTGYFGNRKSHKKWWRITRNEYQLSSPILARPADRLNRLGLDRTRFPRGRRVVLIPTHPKVCEAWQLGNSEDWTRRTLDALRCYTDRDIVVRERPASRHVRQSHDRFQDFIQNDVHAVVAWTSNCLVEAAMHGIPVVSLGPSAALQISAALENIDTLPDLDDDLQEAWLRHLSYGQFTQREMTSGLAWSILNG